MVGEANGGRAGPAMDESFNGLLEGAEGTAGLGSGWHSQRRRSRWPGAAAAGAWAGSLEPKKTREEEEETVVCVTRALRACVL